MQLRYWKANQIQDLPYFIWEYRCDNSSLPGRSAVVEKLKMSWFNQNLRFTIFQKSTFFVLFFWSQIEIPGFLMIKVIIIYAPPKKNAFKELFYCKTNILSNLHLLLCKLKNCVSLISLIYFIILVYFNLYPGLTMLLSLISDSITFRFTSRFYKTSLKIPKIDLEIFSLI